MTQRSHPHRVRLHGGRKTHATRKINGGIDQVTACDTHLPDSGRDINIDPNEPVTCPDCKRALAKADSR